MTHLLARRALLYLGLSTCLASRPSRATQPSRHRVLADDMKRYEIALGGTLGVSASAYGTAWTHDYQDVHRFPLCSTHKLLSVAAILQRVDCGVLHLAQDLPLRRDDILEWAPISRHYANRGAIPLGVACAAALQKSDNTAANLLLRQLGGPEGWTRFARRLGDTASRLDRYEPSLNDVAEGDLRDTTTPRAMHQNVTTLFFDDMLSAKSRLQLQAWTRNNALTQHLMQAGVCDTAHVFDKSGSGNEGARADIGLIRRANRPDIIIAVYMRGARVGRAAQDDAIASITRRLVTEADAHL